MTLWIAKFNRADDRWNYASVEHAMLVLAKKCGISAAESRVVQVGGKHVLLVRRFDRFKIDKGYARAHDQRLDAFAGRRKRARPPTVPVAPPAGPA
jgi:hypothetical protein